MSEHKAGQKSTFDRIMGDPVRKAKFEKGYEDFLISEILSELMDRHQITVRELAEKSCLSPTVVQELKSGKKKNATLSSLNSILTTLGCRLVIKDNRHEYVLTGS